MVEAIYKDTKGKGNDEVYLAEVMHLNCENKTVEARLLNLNNNKK